MIKAQRPSYVAIEQTRMAVDLPSDLFHDFMRLVESSGYKQKRAVAAAMRLFQQAPYDIRTLAMRADEEGLQNCFKRGISDPKP